MHISHFLLHFLIEPIIRFFVDGDYEGDKIYFKFLPLSKLLLLIALEKQF